MSSVSGSADLLPSLHGLPCLPSSLAVFGLGLGGFLSLALRVVALVLAIVKLFFGNVGRPLELVLVFIEVLDVFVANGVYCFFICELRVEIADIQLIRQLGDELRLDLSLQEVLEAEAAEPGVRFDLVWL